MCLDMKAGTKRSLSSWSLSQEKTVYKAQSLQKTKKRGFKEKLF